MHPRIRHTLETAAIVLLFTVFGFFVGGPTIALADKTTTPMSAETTNRTAFVDGEGWVSADVTVWSPSGSTDGTVTVYAVPYSGGPRVQVGQYAGAITAAKTFSGRPNGGLEITFTGRTTGDVTVYVRLKKCQ